MEKKSEHFLHAEKFCCHPFAPPFTLFIKLRNEAPLLRPPNAEAVKLREGEGGSAAPGAVGERAEAQPGRRHRTTHPPLLYKLDFGSDK